ncbi:MAG TPA: molybdopterin-guanine dinucleotide biosynthesis protein B [Casimicrobiaceae bacterium]|nr:molybdopterin-guanine dinucleotide biosynthesis protein B [Casimicrobiaceae bacterium]
MERAHANRPDRPGGPPRAFGFAGWSGSGKTTLIERLIPVLVGRGLVVALVKHAHHDFDVDQPGKDSYRHRKAGAREVLVTSSARWALMHELDDAPEMTLAEAMATLGPCDLVLVEGFKAAPLPKLEVYRPAVGKALLHPQDPHIVAVATDDPAALSGAPIPVIGLDAIDALATLVAARAGPLSAGV